MNLFFVPFLRALGEIDEKSNQDYLHEALETLNDSADTIKYIKEYVPRLRNVLRAKNTEESIMSMDDILRFEVSLKRLIEAIPKSKEEWIKSWIDELGAAAKRNAASHVGDCVICASEGRDLVGMPCSCKESHMCLECVLHTYYVATEGLKKSFFNCPLCKKAITFADITHKTT